MAEKSPKQPNVVFRRVHGRIVPIRVSKREQIKRQEIRGGATLIAGGLTVATGLGVAAGKAEKAAKKFFSDRGGFLRKQAPQHRKPRKRRKKVDPRQMDLGETFTAKAKRRSKFSVRSQFFGRAAGAFLVGVGVERILEATTQDEEARSVFPKAELAGAAASGATLFGLRAGQSRRISKTISAAKKRGGKVAKTIIKLATRGKVRL